MSRSSDHDHHSPDTETITIAHFFSVCFWLWADQHTGVPYLAVDMNEDPKCVSIDPPPFGSLLEVGNFIWDSHSYQVRVCLLKGMITILPLQRHTVMS